MKKLKAFIRRHLTVQKIKSVPTPVWEGNLLQGKVALIMGGSGGIGAEIARSFAKNGCKVIISGRNEEKLRQVAGTMPAEQVACIPGDMRLAEEIEAVVQKAAEAFGRLDIFVHCAGMHCHDPFCHVTEETWDNVMDVNLKSVYFSCQAAANYMIANQIKGHILTVGSASGAKPGWTPYEISKHGVKALTLGFADKLSSYGIVVNSIAPGPVATPMLRLSDPEDLAWPGNPTGRMCTPAEIANWATLLVSDMGNMIVGDTLFVSGGSGTVCLDK